MSGIKVCIQVGMRLEMVDPRNQVEFIPAAVVSCLNAHYVVVEADTLKSAAATSDHSNQQQTNNQTMSTLVKVEEGIQVAGNNTLATNHSTRTIHTLVFMHASLFVRAL